MNAAKPYMGELLPGDERFIGPIVHGFQNKINRKNAIGAREICAKMKQAGMPLTEKRLRKVIHVIRVRGLVKCLIYGPKGYYISSSMNDGRRFTGEMRKKIKLMQDEEAAMTAQYNEYYSPQIFH